MKVASGQSSVASDRPMKDRSQLSGNSRVAGLSPAAGDRRPATEDGVILIALLWVLTALCLIALTFSKESFVEMASARNAQSLEHSYFIARAGIDATIYQLLQKRYAPMARQDIFQDTPDPIDLGKLKGTFGGGVYEVDVQAESGKINVNYINTLEDQFHNLLDVIGIPKPDADIITDSILDWEDLDTNHRLNGAEDDYYQSLNPPYKARNGRIEVVEELLLIRGITPEYFYGHPERNSDRSIIYKYGLSRYITVYSNQIQVNINSAPLPVLMSVPEMPPEAARAIYDRRHVKPFKNVQDISNELGISLPTNTIPRLTVAQPNQVSTYTLTASAHAPDSKVRRIIRAVVSLDPILNKQYRTLYWNENVPDYEGITP
jgi:general secretion pathway protein K